MGSRCPQQSENSISATRGEKPSRYDQSHEKGGPALSQASFFAPLGRKPRISQVRRPKPNQSNDARSTTQQNPIDLSAQSLRASPIDYATHSTTQPSPTGRTTQSIMQLSPTKHTAQPTPHSSPTARAAPPATQSTRRRRPNSPRGATGHTPRNRTRIELQMNIRVQALRAHAHLPREREERIDAHALDLPVLDAL